MEGKGRIGAIGNDGEEGQGGREGELRNHTGSQKWVPMLDIHIGLHK